MGKESLIYCQHSKQFYNKSNYTTTPDPGDYFLRGTCSSASHLNIARVVPEDQGVEYSMPKVIITPCDPPPEFAQPNVEEAKRLLSTYLANVQAGLSMYCGEGVDACKQALAALSGEGEGEQQQCPNDTDDAGAKIITGLKEFRYKLQGGGSIKGTTLVKCNCGEIVRFPCEIKYPATKAEHRALSDEWACLLFRKKWALGEGDNEFVAWNLLGNEDHVAGIFDTASEALEFGKNLVGLVDNGMIQ